MRHKLQMITLLFLLTLMTMFLYGCSNGSARKYYNSGLKLLKQGDYQSATTNFLEAIKLNKNRGEYYISYGDSLLMLDEYEDALMVYSQAIFEKENKVVNENNKKAYRGKGIAYYKSFEYEKAIEQFNLSLAIDELSDLNMDILLYKGDAEIKIGLYEDAMNTYTSILEMDSSNPSVFYKRASVYQALGDYEKSINDYNKAISIDDSNYDYYIGKYFLLKEQGRDSEAQITLEDTSKIKVKTPMDAFNLARVYYYMDQYDKAIDGFKEGIKEGFIESYYYLGNIYEKQENYELAVSNYDLYVTQSNDNNLAFTYNQLGLGLIRLGRYEEALSKLQKGLELNDSALVKTLKRNKIVALEYLGDFSQAYIELNDFITSYPEDDEAKEELIFVETRLPEASSIVN